MYCPQCGGTNDDSARYCTTCGLDMEDYRRQWQQPGPSSTSSESGGAVQGGYQQPYGQQSYGPPPYQQQQYQQQYQQPYQSPQYYQQPGTMPRVPSYMGWAIAVLILCFWPTGIVAVVYASQVNNKLAVGDYAGAVHSSKRAKLWTWITFAIGIAAVVLSIVAFLLAAAASITIY